MIFGFRLSYVLDQNKCLDTGHLVDHRSPPSIIAKTESAPERMQRAPSCWLVCEGEELGMLDPFCSVSHSGRLYRNKSSCTTVCFRY